jgi:hypothetical protein
MSKATGGGDRPDERLIDPTYYMRAVVPPARRWREPFHLRIGLRIFVALVLILGALLAWQINEARQQSRLVKRIERDGGVVLYDWQTRDGLDPNRKPWAPRWLVDRAGVDFFGHPTQVNLVGPFTDSTLDPVGKLSNLESLKLISPEVTDAGLARLGELTALRTLIVNFDRRGTGQDLDKVRPGSGAQINDEGLAYLRRILNGLSDLDLNLAGTLLTDAGLANLEGLSSLQSLDLSGTRVTDVGLSHLKGLKGLERLYLQDLSISAAGLENLSRLPVLRTLSLANTDVTDTDIAELRKLQSLEILFLNDTRVTDAGLERCLADLPGLTYLDLSGTKITDAGLTHLSRLKDLQRLTLKRTSITDAGINSLQAERPQLRVER